MDLEKTKKRMLNLYGIGDFGGDLATAFGTNYRSFYMTNVAMMPLTLQAIISPISSIWGIIAVPLYGTILDKYRSKPGNSYGKLIKIMSPLVILTTFLSWYVMSIEPKILAAICVILMTVVGGFTQQLSYLGNIALMGACADNEQEKGKMSSTRWTAIKVAMVIAPSVALALLSFFEQRGTSAVMTYVLTATTMSVLFPLGYYFNVWACKGMEKEVEHKAEVGGKKSVGLIEAFKLIFTNPHLLALVLTNVLTVVASFLIAMMAAFYFNVAVGKPALLTVYLTISNACGIVSAFFAGILAKRFGLKQCCVGAMAVGIAGLVFATIFKSNVILYMIGVSVYQFAEGVDYAILITMFSSCAVYTHWKTGEDKTATIMSLVSWPLTFGGMISGVFIPTYLASIGYDAKAIAAGAPVTEKMITGLQNAVSLVPCCFYIAAFLVMLFLYRLDSATMKKMEAEIAERQAAAKAEKE